MISGASDKGAVTKSLHSRSSAPGRRPPDIISSQTQKPSRKFERALSAVTRYSARERDRDGQRCAPSATVGHDSRQPTCGQRSKYWLHLAKRNSFLGHEVPDLLHALNLGPRVQTSPRAPVANWCDQTGRFPLPQRLRGSTNEAARDANSKERLRNLLHGRLLRVALQVYQGRVLRRNRRTDHRIHDGLARNMAPGRAQWRNTPDLAILQEVS